MNADVLWSYQEGERWSDMSIVKLADTFAAWNLFVKMLLIRLALFLVSFVGTRIVSMIRYVVKMSRKSDVAE